MDNFMEKVCNGDVGKDRVPIVRDKCVKVIYMPYDDNRSRQTIQECMGKLGTTAVRPIWVIGKDLPKVEGWFYAIDSFELRTSPFEKNNFSLVCTSYIKKYWCDRINEDGIIFASKG